MLIKLLLCMLNGAFDYTAQIACRYGVELMYKQQPLIRARGVSYCKNLLSPRFEHSEGMLLAAKFFLLSSRDIDHIL